MKAVPWAYLRDQLARRYHCAPWQLDEEWPYQDIQEAVALWNLEATCRPKPTRG
ncbi:MAG TPA: hypothetical protein VNM48_08465 [Chloroflexota bacterium]|nr:hypothetical protein [Chloroflexota bacterium]